MTFKQYLPIAVIIMASIVATDLLQGLWRAGVLGFLIGLAVEVGKAQRNEA
jgi:hypothetical protein